MHNIFDMQSADYENTSDDTGFEAKRLHTDQVDQHFAALDADQRVRARCSIWWRDTARLDGTSTGAIGHYAATDAEAGAAVLQQACRELKNRRCGVAVGPLAGNTWRVSHESNPIPVRRPGGLFPQVARDTPLAFPIRPSPIIPTIGRSTSAGPVSQPLRTMCQRLILTSLIASRNSARCARNLTTSACKSNR